MVQAHTQGGEVKGDLIQAHTQGEVGRFSSRPTPKGEVKGDLIQAHTQGGG